MIKATIKMWAIFFLVFFALGILKRCS